MSRLKPELNTQMHDNFNSLPKKKKKREKKVNFPSVTFAQTSVNYCNGTNWTTDLNW